MKTVKYLEESGLPWTVVREATYSHLWNNMAEFLKLGAPVDEVKKAIIPGDGPNHWANREELGVATGRVVGNYVRESFSRFSFCVIPETNNLLQKAYIRKTVTLDPGLTYPRDRRTACQISGTKSQCPHSFTGRDN